MTQVKMRRGGFYFHDKIPYVSVTTVLKIIAKPAIQYWYGNQIYWAMVKDPGLGEKEAMAFPWSEGRTAQARGTAVHSIVEAWKKIGEVKGTDLEEYGGYARAFDNWRKDYDPQPLVHEKSIRSEKYGFGGTLDLLAMVRDRKCLIDVKTNEGANIYDEVQLQLSAYAQGLLEEGEPVDEIWALSLGVDGSFKFKQFQSDLDTFLNAQALWVWNNKAKCKKVGYNMKFGSRKEAE